MMRTRSFTTALIGTTAILSLGLSTTTDADAATRRTCTARLPR